MRARGLAVALVPLGTIAGHVLGYRIAGQDAALSGAHSHLGRIAWPALAVTLVALAWVALAGAEPVARRLRTPALLVAQVGLFGILEAVEHLQGGHRALSLAEQPSFRWGAGAQLVSAAALVVAARLAHASGQLVRARFGRRRVPPPRAQLPARCRVDEPRAAGGPRWSVSERSPPGRPVPA